jgi:ATP-dependent helicase/nuclease subunit A
MNRLGWTGEQQQAITARGASVALSAGAGCGKTFVLTERFLAELEPGGKAPPPHLSQLVAITFTERAAREMRGRIRKACRERLRGCPAEQAGYWLALLRELDSARISTIHAFCGGLLRAHAVEAGLDPRFDVLDAAQAQTLLFELSDEVLRDRLAARDEAALGLVTRFGLDRLREMIGRLLAERAEIDWPLWERETPEGLVARWDDFWRRDTVPRILRQISESAAAKTVLDLALRYPPAHAKMRERCDFLREHLRDLARSEQPAAELKEIREKAKVQGGGTKKHWVNEDVYNQFRDAAKTLRDAIDDVAERMRFDPAAARPAAALALELLALAGDVNRHYDERKRELGMLDFDDLLIRARQLLVGPEQAGLRKRLAAQIRLLLVDEFQDTDARQVEMLKALCDNEHLRGKLFFVGDFKQSIYRFRGAEPHVFRELRDEIPAAGRKSLTENFRSQPAVLDFVNALFAEELGGDYEPLRPHRPQLSEPPAVEFLWACPNVPPLAPREDQGEGETPQAKALTRQEEALTLTLSQRERGQDEALSQRERGPENALSQREPGPGDGNDLGSREQLRRREADWIARRIRAMLDSGTKIVWDEEAAKAGQPALRAVKQGDVALLFRALTNVEYYEEALRRYGIDYYLVGGHAFYAQQEIYDLLNLLRAIDSGCDEVSLVGVLRSPFFGLLDETLLWLSQEKGLAEGLFAEDLPEELDGQQRQQVQHAAATLRALRAMKDRLPVAQLIYEALDRTGYDALLLAEFLGERKLANLHKLIEQTRSFDRTGIFMLSDFITQLSQFVVRQPDEPLAATHLESHNVVRLMSIHQSKGLEFPVVIVPDVGRPRRPIGPAAAFTPELGPMFKDEATTGYDLLTMAENEEDLAELSRLLYVATTRAADYLILSAGVEEPGKVCGPWMELLAKRFDLLSGSTLSSPGTRTGSRLATVTTTQPAIQSKPVDLRQRRDLLKILEKARQMAAEGQGRQSRYLGPVAPDAGARRQYSFSRLTGKLHARAMGSEPSSLESDGSPVRPLDARGLGTLVHEVLAEVDFSRPGDVADLVRRHADEQAADGRGDNGEAAELISRFLASPRAAAIAAAEKAYRELEFLLAWPPAGEQTGSGADVPEPPARYLQGFIDCLYCDAEGQWRLVDYKTNRVTADTLPVVAGNYEMQMLVYALAVERILKRPPAELVLCFLRPGLEYHFVWDAAARKRVLELVDRALP